MVEVVVCCPSCSPDGFHKLRKRYRLTVFFKVGLMNEVSDKGSIESTGEPALSAASSAPKLSVTVVMYRMTQQISNTLRSLTVPYQRELQEDDFEIIVVDNGSPEPLPREAWSVARNVQYHYIFPEDASPNPGTALNWAVKQARAPIVCLMIDGARIVTPGTLRRGLEGTSLSSTAITEVRGWHLGPKNQIDSIEEGYTAEVEGELLNSVRWRENGYRLFEISQPSGSTPFGFLGRARECNCLFMHRSFFNALDGYDERYRHPGGGFVNIDFFRRAVSAATTVFTLLGEGHFHQTHGGASTGLVRARRQEVVRDWRAEYARLSRPLDRNPPEYDPILIGHIPKECARWFNTDWMT